MALGIACAMAATGQGHAQAIVLGKWLGGPKQKAETFQAITGGCGPAVVRVLGVTFVGSDTFSIDLDAGDVIVRNSRSDGYRELSAAKHLSDHNGVACVGPPGREKLLIWSNCGGSACGDEFGFTVIDPIEVRILAPSKPTDICDAACATRLTQSPLPVRLNNRFN